MMTKDLKMVIESEGKRGIEAFNWEFVWGRLVRWLWSNLLGL